MLGTTEGEKELNIGEFFVEYNRLLILGALLTVLLMASLLGAPVLAGGPGGGFPG